MDRLARVLVVALTIGCCHLWAQQPSSSEDLSLHNLNHEKQSRRWKAESGLIISWLAFSTDATANQVEIFDVGGRRLASVHVLEVVPKAARVAIYDVSAREGQMIAVGAVFAKKPEAGERPADTLLLFDFGGKLVSAFALEPSREISKIAIDDRLNIWTLTMHSDDKDPLKVPMVVAYDRSGNIRREVLTRGMFPLHAEIQQESSRTGPVSSGYDSDIFWFWLPGSTELVTVNTNDGTTAITKTGLPGADMVPLETVRERSGGLVAEVRRTTGRNGSLGPFFYAWSATTKAWTQFDPAPCNARILMGADGKELVFRKLEDNSLCKSEEP
jgi:hypothetical protein